MVKRNDPGKAVRKGWTLGFLGASLAVPLIGLVFVLGGRAATGMGAFGLWFACLAAAYLFRPWARQQTQIRLLYLGALAPWLASLAYLVWALVGSTGLSSLTPSTMIAPLLAVFVPFFTFGRRTYAEISGEKR